MNIQTREPMMFRFFLFLTATLWILPASAATFTVERDGSGDFMVIQDAVDAAASGDTIQIGPGRYNEFQIVETLGYTSKVRVLVHQEELTLIGAGPDHTIIGKPDPYYYSHGDERGVLGGPYFGNHFVRVVGIRVENMEYGIIGGNAPGFEIRNCEFEGNRDGFAAGPGGRTTVEDCKFRFPAEDGSNLVALGVESIRIQNCDFEMAENNYGLQISIVVDTTPSVMIDNCRFLEGKIATSFSGDQSLTISNSIFQGQSRRGLGFSSSSALVANCHFEDQGEAIYVANGSELRVQDTNFVNVSKYTFAVTSFNFLQATNCILAHGPDYTVCETTFCDKSTATDFQHIDLRNNDWGTDDAEAIASWIHTCAYVVDYIPFIGQPVATEPITLDGLKAWYR